MKSWSLFLINGIILFFLFPQRVQSDCGPSSSPLLYTYSFLQPALVDPKAPGAPFFLDFDVLYEQYGQQRYNQIEENIKEWGSRYCNEANLASIYELIYNSTLSEFRGLRNSINNKKLPLPGRLEANAFARYLRENKCLETADYLIYAKRCERFAVESDAWELQDGNADRMRALIDEGRDEFKRTKSYYIRLRYAYQIIRMAHYLHDYPLTLELYDFLMPKIDNDPSIVENWILGHKAGAMMSLGQTVAASYLFSKIFEESFGKRESAYRSFNITTEKEWNECLLLCQNDTERATLYALRANAPNSKALADMREIYRLTPESSHLDVLLIKELKRLEKNLLGLEFNPQQQKNQQFFQVPRPGMGQYVIDLQAFVREYAQDNPGKSPALWKLAEGYLETLAGDYYAAERTFARAKKLSQNTVLTEQLEALRLVAQVAAYRQVDETIETEVARIKLDDETYDRFPDFKRFIGDKMSWLYKQSGDVGKLYLQQHNLTDLKANPDLEVIDELISIAEKELPNRLERDMIRKEDGSTILNDLINIKGTYLMGRGEVVAALEEFKKMDRDLWDDYGMFNPFEERLIDCINCSERDSLTLYSKPVIVERILDYEYKALANRQEGAQYFYRIGLAYYNMSYFGYAWKTGDFFRSGSSIRNRNRGEDGVIPTWQFDLGNLENFSNERALEYFDKVVALTNNRELAARAAFMAAKCEQNAYYVNGGARTYKYFEILKTRFADTRFYQRAISECKYFNTYAAR